MKKPDEIEFMASILIWQGKIPTTRWDVLTKRQYHLLGKWTSIGWWEFGVTLRAGWLTDVGRLEFEKCVNETMCVQKIIV